MIADGIYPNVPPQIYFDDPEWQGRMSPSILENAMEKNGQGGTMAHVKAAFDGSIEDEDSKALRTGRACHAAVLEPKRFKSDYAQAQRCEAKNDNGKGPQCSKMGTVLAPSGWLCSTHAKHLPSQIEVYSATDAEIIKGVRASIFAHPAVNLLREAGGYEVSLAWTCPRTEVKCKTRLDYLIENVPEWGCGVIVDLKFVRCASQRAVEYAIRDYGWARAAAMRIDGLEALTGKEYAYCLICCEKEPPYLCSVPAIGTETLAGARWDVRTNLVNWARCVKENKWPGYGDDFMEVETAFDELKRYRSIVGGAE